MIIIIFLWIGLKRRIKESTVFKKKAKTHILNVLQKLNFLSNINVLFNQKQRSIRRTRRTSLIKKSSRKSAVKDKLGEQIYHENIKKVFEPVTNTIKNTSEKLTKTIMLTSKQYNKALENLNDNLLELLNNRGIIASFSLSPLSKITNEKNTS